MVCSSLIHGTVSTAWVHESCSLCSAATSMKWSRARYCLPVTRFSYAQGAFEAASELFYEFVLRSELFPRVLLLFSTKALPH